MALDPKFNKFSTANPTIATFSGEEIASGEQFVQFFIGMAEDDTGEDNILSSVQFFSSKIETVATNTVTTVDFDTSPFNLPRTVDGSALLQFGYRTSPGTGETIQARLKKWDGSSETNITDNFTISPGSAIVVGNFLMPCTETLIPAGEQLRLTMIATGTGGGEFTALGHDPQNRDGTKIVPSGTNDVITSTRINVPFKPE